MPSKPSAPDDFSDDFTIQLSDEVANTPLTVGDFMDAMALVQNRLNLMSMAIIGAASGESQVVREKLRASIETGKDINRLLAELAGNVGSARNGE